MNRLQQTVFSYFTQWEMIRYILREAMENDKPIEHYKDEFQQLDTIISELMPIMEYIKNEQVDFYENINLYLKTRNKIEEQR